MMALNTSRKGGTENVRMGPIALFTLIAVLCLAVLAVLATSTAGATVALSQRRARATSQLYLQEQAAQVFVATLDAGLAQGTTPRRALADACATAEAQGTETDQLSVEASGEHPSYTASFDCGNGRLLEIALHYGADDALHVDQWRMKTVVNDEPPIGTLLGSS